MPKRIYVGNLPFSASDHEVRVMFERFGNVESVRLSPGRGRSGPQTAEIVMTDDSQALRAIAGLNGKRVGTASLNVNEARPR